MKIQQALTQALVQSLSHHHLKLVTAESCTGGMLASHLTALPGSSNWFDCGFVTYSNASKTALIGVPKALLAQYGAVSVEVAHAMAAGALDASEADLSISITGIAGPSGGTKDKPVGTVCFGWANKQQIITKQIQFPATTRDRIRLLACCKAMQGAIDFITRTLPN